MQQLLAELDEQQHRVDLAGMRMIIQVKWIEQLLALRADIERVSDQGLVILIGHDRHVLLCRLAALFIWEFVPRSVQWTKKVEGKGARALCPATWSTSIPDGATTGLTAAHMLLDVQVHLQVYNFLNISDSFQNYLEI